MKKIKIVLLTLIFWLLLYPFQLGSKPLAEALKAQAGLPGHNQEISVIVEKNQIKKQLEVADLPEKAPVYYSLTNLGRKSIKPQAVINGRDWFSDRSIVDYALNEIDQENLTDEEKTLAIFYFMVKNTYHWTPPLYDTSYYFIENPVQYLNNWGYGYCGNTARVLAQLLFLAGYKARLVNLTNHIVTEVFYDESWHGLDPDTGLYYRSQTGKIASAEEIINNKQLLESPIWIKDKQTVIKINRLSGSSNWDQAALDLAYSEKVWRYTPAEESLANTDYRKELWYHMRPNEEIRFYYDFKDKYYWGFKSDPPPEYTNGVLISDNNGGVFKFQLPFPILASYIFRPNLCRAAEPIRFSLDGWHWQKITACENDVLNLTDLFPRGEGSFPTQQYFLALPLSLTDYQILTQFQTAAKSIPVPTIGVNELELKNPLRSDIKVEFGY